jgi:hypothetical protein
VAKRRSANRVVGVNANVLGARALIRGLIGWSRRC